MVLFGPVLDVVVSLCVCNALSVTMTLFLKWFLYKWHGHGYPFATTMTLVHMVFQWIVASALLRWWKKPCHHKLPPRDYWTLVVPIAVSASLNILCSNLAFYYITVTLSTVARSTLNVWTLLLSIWLGHQRFSYAIVAVIGLISLGVALSTLHSTQFHLGGFVLALSSAFLQTLQCVLTQSLLKRLDDNVASPVLTSISLISPTSALCLLPLAAVLDGPSLVYSEIVRDPRLLFESSGWVLLSGAIACALVFSKVVLIYQTSALTLGVSSSCRDVLQILFAVVWFGDEISATNGIGLTAVITGVFFYTVLKNQKRLRKSIGVGLGTPDDSHRVDSTRDLASHAVCLSPPRSPSLSKTASYHTAISCTPVTQEHGLHALSHDENQYNCAQEDRSPSGFV